VSAALSTALSSSSNGQALAGRVSEREMSGRGAARQLLNEAFDADRRYKHWGQ
jgi:hypothetical protein